MEQSLIYDPEIVKAGGCSFLYLRDSSGARFIRVDNILSIVPNFRLGGSMIFIGNADKAITVEHEPHEIKESLPNEN
jgi:hypothetical protein